MTLDKIKFKWVRRPLLVLHVVFATILLLLASIADAVWGFGAHLRTIIDATRKIW